MVAIHISLRQLSPARTVGLGILSFRTAPIRTIISIAAAFILLIEVVHFSALLNHTYAPMPSLTFDHHINDCTNTSNVKKEINPGWNDTAWNLYRERVQSLSRAGITTTAAMPLGNTQSFYVSNDDVESSGFWSRLPRGGWETHSFQVFQKYITNETTVVDFGAWIGPTLLYHGQLSNRSYGIEADPVAFAVGQFNVELNQKLNPHWGKRVSMDAACISAPGDVGIRSMKAGGDPGQSMSGIGSKVARDKGSAAVEWEVQCYTLPDILENYWGLGKLYEDLFVKIDVESYECKLIPSFYDWLKSETYLPIMYISFHPQIEPCTEGEFEGVFDFLTLYDWIDAGGEEWKVSDTRIEDMKEILKAEVLVLQNRHRIKLQ